MSSINPFAALTGLIEHSHFLAQQPAFRRGTVATVRTGAGFTIVELLIVIVVIGILAAIVIVAFNGIQDRARETSIQSDLNNFAKKVKIYHAENGQYPSTAQMTASMGITVNKSMYTSGAGENNNWYYCSNTARTRFAVGATANTARDGFVYDSDTGMREQAGLWGSTTCPSTLVSDPYYGSGAWSGYSCTGTCAWQPYITG